MRQENNVIHVDFGNHRHSSLNIGIRTEILFQDEHAYLIRATMTFAGQEYIQHILMEND
ncbi:hypothetical protein [Zavarzinella formosa]|uniref:hypothetical protein n=1 Tax=Zavarzinella formosa TaxID=360055 RepID=UPI0002E5A443|nr:hypothetical protein [Zavarzinella formosa]